VLVDWLTAATPPHAGRGAGRAPAAARRDHLRAHRPCGDRAQRELLCAGLRAIRPAGAGAGNRAPGKGAARPGADREESRMALVRAEAPMPMPRSAW
jgi:hypothetical protein